MRAAYAHGYFQSGAACSRWQFPVTARAEKVFRASLLDAADFCTRFSASSSHVFHGRCRRGSALLSLSPPLSDARTVSPACGVFAKRRRAVHLLKVQSLTCRVFALRPVCPGRSGGARAQVISPSGWMAPLRRRRMAFPVGPIYVILNYKEYNSVKHLMCFMSGHLAWRL